MIRIREWLWRRVVRRSLRDYHRAMTEEEARLINEQIMNSPGRKLPPRNG